jgi:hypothetical protein
MYCTKCGTYVVNQLIVGTKLSECTDWKPYEVPDINTKKHFIPNHWDGYKKKYLLSLLRDCKDLVPRIYSRIIGEIAYSRPFQSLNFKIIPEDYYFILGLSGLIYDFLENEIGLNLTIDSIITTKEWEVVKLISTLYLDEERLVKISTYRYIQRMFDHLLICKLGIHPLEVFRLLQALVSAQVENTSIYFKFKEIESCLRLSLNNPINFKIIPYYRISNLYWTIKLEEDISLILLTHENIINLLEDPYSSYATPFEFEHDMYHSVCGLSVVELRYSLLNLILLNIEFYTSRSVGSEMYLWYHSNSPNVLSKNSLNNLISRLSKYSRKNWNTERIMMTARRLCSPNYSIAKFIREYDEEIINERKSYSEKLYKSLKRLGPLYDFEPDLDKLLINMIQDNAFSIPLLSPYGLLTVLTMIDFKVPLWIPGLLQLAMVRGDHKDSIFKDNVVGVQMPGSPGIMILKRIPKSQTAS